MFVVEVGSILDDAPVPSRRLHRKRRGVPFIYPADIHLALDNGALRKFRGIDG